jgi:hypothetical protein
MPQEYLIGHLWADFPLDKGQPILELCILVSRPFFIFMSQPLLPKCDLEKFTWKAKDEGGQTRVLAGIEKSQDIFDRLMNGRGSVFVAVYLDFSSPVGYAKLQSARYSAWIWLRYHLPNIAIRLRMNEKHESTYSYDSGNVTDITQWANRTFKFSVQYEVDLDALRVGLASKDVPSKEGDLTWMHLHAGPGDANGDLWKFGLLIHTHYSVFDMATLKVILNQYLQRLTQTLCGEEAAIDSLRWGDESGNFMPVSYFVMSKSAPRPIPSASLTTALTHPNKIPYERVMEIIPEPQTVSIHPEIRILTKISHIETLRIQSSAIRPP